MSQSQRREREPWFVIRRDLSPGRQAALTAISFLAPLLIWCLVSYVPFIWHPDVKLQVGATAGSTVYTAGDHIGKDYFPEVVEGVRQANAQLMEQRKAGNAPSSSRRNNEKVLRKIAQVAIDNSLLSEDDRENDEVIYELWGDIAGDPKLLRRPKLSDENLDIVRQNWETMSFYSETHNSDNFPKEPLLNLIPQGRLANPVYLPAPDEVWRTGFRDWKRHPAEGKKSMFEKYVHSLGIVYGGFLLAALFAVPLGLVGGTYDFFGKLIEPFSDFFRYMPAPAFGTLLVAVLGAHNAPKIALVFIGTFPHLLLMLTKTSRLLDRSMIEAAQTLGASRVELLFRVVVPGTISNVYNDLRIALGWAWTWLVIAELIGVKSGLTEVIDTQGDRRNFDRVFPVIILIGITGFVTDQLLAWIRPKLFPWLGNDSRKQGLLGVLITAVPGWIQLGLQACRKLK
ncbi:MAG: ABC transporter permease [Verrucomicrobiota bacterium]